MKTLRSIAICLFLLLMLPLAMEARAEVPPNQEESTQALKDAITESCIYNRKIDISQYNITLEELEELFYYMIDQGEVPWYTERTYFRHEEDPETNQVLTFEPKLLPESRYNQAFYQQRLAEIYQECVLEGMADWQIALSVHDYLIVHGYYDISLNERTGYDLLDNGRTVCTGYTEVFRELMTMAGIPCVNVVSDDMRHTWNLVKIGGKWYHVDVTWDDPTPDCYGRVMHTYFLVSDQEISSGNDPHHGWESEYKCNDHTYSTAFWRNLYNPIIFTDADTCYLIRDERLSNAVYKRTISTGKETCLYKEKDTFLNIGAGSYRYRHCGLSLWNDRLWVCTMTTVLSMDMDGKDVRTEFTYNAKQNKRYLAGFYVDKDTLRYLTVEHVGYELKQKENLEPTGYHAHEYTQTVVEPTCDAPGYTISECSCGIRCESTPRYHLEHDFQETELLQPTLLKDGKCTETCTLCGESKSESIPKLTFRERFSNAAIGAIGGALVGVIVLIFMLIARKFVRANARNYPAPQTTPEELPQEELPQEELPQEEALQDEPPADTD